VVDDNGNVLREGSNKARRSGPAVPRLSGRPVPATADCAGGRARSCSADGPGKADLTRGPLTGRRRIRGATPRMRVVDRQDGGRSAGKDGDGKWEDRGSVKEIGKTHDIEDSGNRIEETGQRGRRRERERGNAAKSEQNTLEGWLGERNQAVFSIVGLLAVGDCSLPMFLRREPTR